MIQSFFALRTFVVTAILVIKVKFLIHLSKYNQKLLINATLLILFYLVVFLTSSRLIIRPDAAALVSPIAACIFAMPNLKRSLKSSICN